MNDRQRLQARIQRARASRCEWPRSTAHSVRFLLSALLALTLLLSVGCSESADSSGSAPGDGTRDGRPSIVLLVVESLRTDAVGSYGRDRGSPLPLSDVSATPQLDALAAEGTRYAWAIAASPETVASHASLFTGLRVDQHGAGLWTNAIASPELETIAEALSAAGYETAGFSENPMVGPEFGLDQGFEHFAAPDPAKVAAGLARGQGPGSEFGVVHQVREWLANRDASRPYLLFVNLSDPHHPLERREPNPFMPEGLQPARIENLMKKRPHEALICRKLPDPESLEILGALYLAEVESADRKLGEIVELTRTDADRSGSRPPVTLATADHGASFGEDRLLGHAFSVHNRVVRVPLITVSGELPPGVIETPIAQRRLASSIRCWAGETDRCDEGLPTQEPIEPEPVVSILGNQTLARPPAAVFDTRSLTGDANYTNALCDAEDGFDGPALAYLKGSMKYVWRERAGARLFDLSWDPNEKSDQMGRRADLAEPLRNEVESFLAQHRIDRVHERPLEGSLSENALKAYESAREQVLAATQPPVDQVWFAQLVNRARPDPELAAWIEARIPAYEKDPFYRIIAPSAPSSQDVPKDPGRGLARWAIYLRASVAGPDTLALPYLMDYLAMPAKGYILTHQLTALEWARAAGRALPDAAYASGPKLLAQISREHEADPFFSDLWVERAAFLTAFDDPSPQALEDWAAFIVEHHLGDGDWGQGGTDMEFDGQKKLARHPRGHTRGMAMIVLASYLKSQGG